MKEVLRTPMAHVLSCLQIKHATNSASFQLPAYANKMRPHFVSVSGLTSWKLCVRCGLERHTMSQPSFEVGAIVVPKFTPIYRRGSRSVNDTKGLITEGTLLIITRCVALREGGYVLRFKGKQHFEYESAFFNELPADSLEPPQNGIESAKAA